MVRRGEITREKALAMHKADNIAEKPANYKQMLDLFDITDADMENVYKIKPLKYERHVSLANKLFFRLMKLIKK